MTNEQNERLLKYYVWNDKLQVMVFARQPLEAIIHALSFKGINSTREAIKACSDYLTWDKFYVDQRGFRDKPEVLQITVGPNGITEVNEIVSGASAALSRREVLPWIDVMHRAYDPFVDNED